MSVNDEAEMETRIIDFIKNNGECTALIISKALGVDKKIINKHLYKLQKSNLLKNTEGIPPVWDLKQETDDFKSELISDSRSIDTVSIEKEVSDILRSGGKTGLKAHQIAKDVGQPKKTVKKLLYSMEKKGEVQKSDSKQWMTKNETSLKQHSKSCDDVKVSDLGLSSCFHEITQLGSGGFGCVFKARHKFDGKMFAVKIVELTKNADSEVKALAQLNHPNIVRYITCWPSSETWESYQDIQSSSSLDIVFDGSDHDDISDISSGLESLDTTSESECAAEPLENHSTDSVDPLNQLYLFIQMDFCEGGTLTTWIEERNLMKKKRTTEEMYQIFYEIVSGVEYIHSNKLIHRDLKPDNIFFTAEGKVKIGDFGLVAPLMNPNGGSAYRSIGRGTPSYMSPEQENERHYDAKTDIFPLGLIWFEMLWKLSSGMERGKLWPDLRKQTFPEGFCDKHPNDYEFIRKMLSHTPRDRPQAKEIKENLDRFFCSDQNLDVVVKPTFDGRDLCSTGGVWHLIRENRHYALIASDKAEMETRIIDFIKNNGKSTALTISEALVVDEKIINKLLYKLQKSNLLKMTQGPPVWDLKENTDDPKSELTYDSGSIDAIESEILKSIGETGLKAYQITKDVGQPKETVKQHLYSMEKKGKVWKSDSYLSMPKSETSLKQYSKSCEDVSVSDLGFRLYQCFHEITHLGSGGFGCVFKARHKHDDKMYAVKRVKLTKDADSEVKALVKFNHPNIVRYITSWQSSETWKSYQDKSSQSSSSVDNNIVFEGSNHDISNGSSGVESGEDTTSESECSAEPLENHSTDSEDPNQLYLFIQMDFCEGGTLTTWIEERNFTEKQRTTDEIYKIFYEIVSGVEYIHSKKFIHRDLKPDNIFFTADGKVKIGDFGLVASLVNPNGGSASRSIGKGTPLYMSPEQEKERRCNAKTDIFPLGLIWFEMLWKMSSRMERGKIWSDLRKQTFPEGFCHEHKNEYKFIRKMLSHTPQDRPKAKRIKENLDTFFYRPTDQNVLSQKTI
nr:protein kinase containing Z-DNA binding domains [Misgurnus anguillicaudatus]